MSEPDRPTTPAVPPLDGRTVALSSAASVSAAAEGDNKDWPVAATDAVVDMVHQVRDKTTGPALKISRAVVYGTVAAILGLMAAILFVIGAVRAIVLVLPDGYPYLAHLILGGIFTLLGAFLWTKRSAKPA